MSKYSLYEIKVFMFLTNDKGEYLFMENTQPDSIIHGYVSPPSGHMEVGEALQTTALREVNEELSIEKLENVELRGLVNVNGFKENPLLLLITSALVPSDQIPQENNEGKPIWVKSSELNNYKIFSDIESFIKLLEKYPVGKLFHAVSKFENKKLISFDVIE